MDDVAYGVPWYVDTRVLYYRTDMAEAAGVEPPTTWDEYKAFAQAMKDAGRHIRRLAPARAASTRGSTCCRSCGSRAATS